MGTAQPQYDFIPPAKQITVLIEGGIKGAYEIKYVSTQLRNYVIRKHIRDFKIKNNIY